jgi:tetratricopeptide (TPR) repeat protein
VYDFKTRTFCRFQARFLAQRERRHFDPVAYEKTAPKLPGSRLDWYLTGLEKYREGKYTEAADACAEALKTKEKDFWTHYVLALCWLRLQQWAPAQDELTICRQQRPEFAWPPLLHGFAASEAGFKLLVLDRLNNGKVADEEFKTATSDFALALKLDQSALVQYTGLVNRGVLFIRQERYQKAVDDLQRAAKLLPKEFQAHLNLAQALQGLGKKKEALAAMNQAVQAAPSRAIVYDSRARMHLLAKNFEPAQADFERAIACEILPILGPSLVGVLSAPLSNGPMLAGNLFPGRFDLQLLNPNAPRLAENYLELGRLLNREKRFIEALQKYDTALRLHPELTLVQRFRAETLMALNQWDAAEQALDDYLNALRQANVMPPADVLQARGLLYGRVGQLQKSIVMYTLALHAADQNEHKISETLTLRGWAHLLSDAAPLALEDFEASLRADASLDALIGRGNAHIRLKQLDLALADAQAAERQGGLSDRLLYHLAGLYALAAGQLDMELRNASSSVDRRRTQRLNLCRAKAVEYLHQALLKLPAERQAAFWRNRVQNDPTFAAIRGEGVYQMLAGKWQGK